MIKRIKHFVLIGAVAGLCLPAVAAQASQPQDNHDMAGFYKQIDKLPSARPRAPRNVLQYSQQRTSQRRISASQAKSIALRRHPGAQFINISLRGNTYRVRLKLNNGRIIDVSVDARAR